MLFASLPYEVFAYRPRTPHLNVGLGRQRSEEKKLHPSSRNYTFNIEMWGTGLFQFMCVGMLFLAQV